MRIRSILALLFLVLPYTLQAQQYATTKTWGLSPLDSLKSTTNLWYPIPPGVCNLTGISFDNKIFCTYNGTTTPSAANVLDYFSKSAQQWTQITGVGSGIMGFAAITVNDVYTLKVSSSCTSFGGYGIFHWDGTNLTQIAGCATQINVSDDGSVVATNTAHNPTQIYFLAPGATTWAYPANDQSSGWTYASVMDQYTMCGVKNNLIQLYSVGTGVFTQMPVQPQGGYTYSCHISNDPNDGLTLVAMYKTTNNHGQYITAVAKYDFANNVWDYIVTPSQPLAIASISKWQTVMFDSSGHPFHFNVNGMSYTVTTSGTGPNCPGFSSCPSGTQHSQTLCVTLPGGLYSGCGTQSVAPTTYLNNQRFDVTATGCDALFGGGCEPVDTGDVMCSASGSDLGGPNGTGSPLTLFSEYIGWWDGYFSPEAAIYSTFMGLPMVEVPVRVGDNENACRMGTYAVCAPPYGQDTIGITGVCWGVGCSAVTATNAANTKAKAHAPGKPIGFGTFYTYTDGDPNSCNLITWYDEEAGKVPCY